MQPAESKVELDMSIADAAKQTDLVREINGKLEVGKQLDFQKLMLFLMCDFWRLDCAGFLGHGHRPLPSLAQKNFRVACCGTAQPVGFPLHASDAG